MSTKYNTKLKWLAQILEYAYEGCFAQATNLIRRGKYDKKLNYKLTKNDATEILINCSIDLRYAFIKPLILLDGKVPKTTIQFAKNVLNDNKAYETFNKIPSSINAYKYINNI